MSGVLNGKATEPLSRGPFGTERHSPRSQLPGPHVGTFRTEYGTSNRLAGGFHTFECEKYRVGISVRERNEYFVLYLQILICMLYSYQLIPLESLTKSLEEANYQRSKA